MNWPDPTQGDLDAHDARRDDERKRRACQGKISFPSRKNAQARARAIAKVDRSDGPASMWRIAVRAVVGGTSGIVGRGSSDVRSRASARTAQWTDGVSRNCCAISFS